MTAEADLRLAYNLTHAHRPIVKHKRTLLLRDGGAKPHRTSVRKARATLSRKAVFGQAAKHFLLILCNVSKLWWSHSNTTGKGRLIRMRLVAPDPGVSLLRIGELLSEKGGDRLPATRMRLHIAVVGGSNGHYLRWT